MLMVTARVHSTQASPGAVNTDGPGRVITVITGYLFPPVVSTLRVSGLVTVK